MSRSRSNNTAFKDSGHLVPKYATLDNFSALVSSEKGIRLTDLAPMTRILLRTCNTNYLITVLDPITSAIKVEGGRYFPIATEAILWGSSLGGAFIRTGLIGIGFQLEFGYQSADGKFRKLVTSPVDHLFIEQQSSLHTNSDQPDFK